MSCFEAQPQKENYHKQYDIQGHSHKNILRMLYPSHALEFHQKQQTNIDQFRSVVIQQHKKIKAKTVFNLGFCSCLVLKLIF